ncbi:7005_t:CDS:1 [Ambispora leptoticha]|uniref:7005_t:CDS:1 n=1 Tax=Ambispora leptoticha TaxID=144679 RepID=A0A9N9CS51_9GLOM|nr:7005_t:CDS:1 [Ambispora leptoticha]
MPDSPPSLPIVMPTDYRAKFNAEPTSCDENFTAEVQRILTMLNTSTARLDEIEQVLQNYHNNFGRVATEFESINGAISTLQNEIDRRYAIIQRIEPIEEAEVRDNPHLINKVMQINPKLLPV